MEKLRGEILELLQSEPNGIPERKLCEMYNKKYRCNLRAKSYGFGSINELIKSMTDLVDIVPSSGKNMVFKLKPTQRAGVAKTDENVAKGSKPASAPLPNMEITNSNIASQLMFPFAPLPQAPGAMYGQNVTPMSSMFYSPPLVRFPIPQVATFGFTERQTASPALSTSSSEDDLEKNRGCAKPKSYQKEETSKKVNQPATDFSLGPERNTTGQPAELCTLNQKINASINPGSRSASPALTTVSSEDFPALDTKISKEMLKKLKEEELQKMRSKDRFTQNYHRCVREEHASVMQAVEMLASDPLLSSQNRRINVEEVNQQTEEFIRALAAEGEQVTETKVLHRVCRHFRVQNLKDIGIWSPVKQLSAIQELRRTQREVTIFIEAFETIRTVCTLYELNQCLGALKNKQSFEDLKLGPLCKQPLVHRLFKVPESLKDEDIFEIETVDILQSIRAYRKSSKAQRIDLADFIKYLADQYRCDSPYALGIRITSIGLLISTLGKASSTERAAIDKAKNRVQNEIEEEVNNRFNKVKKSVMDPFGGPHLYSTSGSLDLRKQYASMTAADAILQVFFNIKDVFSGKMTKYVQEFLIKIGEDRLARSLFQLAICCGSLEVPQDLVAKEKPDKAVVNRAKDNETPLPSEGSVREYLEKTLSTVTGYLSLVYLCKLEKKLVDHFKLKGFVHMGHGTFLEYLLKHSQLLEETAGGSLFLHPQDAGTCGLRPSYQDVYEFIRQCGSLEESMFPTIKAALCNQFWVRDIKELGYGTLSNIVKMVQRQTKSHSGHNNPQSLVLYETALFIEESSHCSIDSSSSVGLLGDLSKEQALSCLLNAPLLEDLAEWSQWETVFEAQHGSLKDFIERHCGKKAAHLGCESSVVFNDLVVIEVKPGVLLRLTTETSPDLFAQAATLHDPVGTAGHLVSIVAADGLRNAPLALLANHVETTLAAIGGSEANILTTKGVASNLSAKFILDCLIRIPVRLCKSLLQKVFLEPFSRVIGQSESKELLLQAARSSSMHLNRLHELGILLGITEWIRDYQTKLDPAKLVKLASKATKTVDSVSVSSRSSLADLSETEDSDVAKSESNSEYKSASISSDDEVDEDSEKFMLADEVSAQPPSEEKPPEHSSDIVVVNDAPPGSSDLTNSEECSAGIADEERNEHRTIIESIRKSEFGIGIELNNEGKKLMEVHQNRLGRSLERLSTELYSKDTHFVLELIQNADDNSYPPYSDSPPSLLFVVEKDCIILLNNECGFQEKHIRAICDVGCSTKGKHEYGYIGQKGIGFKSVFKVTDTPEIHSNGFHICFDKHSGPMGYILPHWIDDTRPVNLIGSEAEKTRWRTKIVLPLKTQNQQAQSLFHDIDPSLLLFLHRLRSITIINKVKGQNFLVTRQDLNNNILEVKHKTGTDRWLVIKKTLDARKIKDNVELTELALAFKLNMEKRKLAVRCLPEKQPVFAFLPLRSFGFRFIIQGDFDIPSSREDIDRDSPWNQWLRSEIPQLFLKAMETFNSTGNPLLFPD
ncbi:protein NO VEIN-like [Rhincodon typus]|uniref:protein NO VEIN-like n=1 Tax=Rhincodon typus TaxID=259920 RepID=UPI00202E906D|nr:protein NO VEIN-like [Rhincodon typus]